MKNVGLNRGFTIVELLIVVVIIGILAAIVIVAYNGVTQLAKESSIKSDLSNAKKKLELYKADNGSYPANITQLGNADIKASKETYDVSQNNFYYCYNKVTGDFALGGRTTPTTGGFIISSSGAVQKVPTVDGTKVCQAIGLTGWDDPDAWITNGHTSGTGWLSWVK